MGADRMVPVCVLARLARVPIAGHECRYCVFLSSLRSIVNGYARNLDVGQITQRKLDGSMAEAASTMEGKLSSRHPGLYRDASAENGTRSQVERTILNSNLSIASFLMTWWAFSFLSYQMQIPPLQKLKVYYRHAEYQRPLLMTLVIRLQAITHLDGRTCHAVSLAGQRTSATSSVLNAKPNN